MTAGHGHLLSPLLAILSLSQTISRLHPYLERESHLRILHTLGGNKSFWPINLQVSRPRPREIETLGGESEKEREREGQKDSENICTLKMRKS